MKITTTLLALAVVVAAAAAVGCEKKANDRSGTTETTGAKAPDNTGVNERDRDRGAVTPMNQNNDQADLDTTQAIRKAVMADDSLSMTAKNVKIITENGVITLRGPVKSMAEKRAIEAEARSAAAGRKVDSQLEVAEEK